MELKPAICLDLDGTVQYSASGSVFISGPDDVALYPDVEDKLWYYRNQGYIIAGLTNQGGVAYGYKTTKGVQEELDAMQRLFKRNPFHWVCRCFNHSSGTVEPFNHKALLRKPGIGMLAVVEYLSLKWGWVVDWEKSVMVGDRPEDYQCARSAEITFYWANDFFNREYPKPDHFDNQPDWDIWRQSDVDLYGDK